MSLTLFYHPLASFCWKALIALQHREVPFTRRLVDLADEASSAELRRIWPLAKFPVLRDESNGRVLPETSVIIEYADRFGDAMPLVPVGPDEALEVRLWDRFFDNYLQVPMQKLVGDRIAGGADPGGVANAKATIQTAYKILEAFIADKRWAVGSGFTLADCAAAPALFYAMVVEPPAQESPAARAYGDRLFAVPAVQRVIDDAKPHFEDFPFADAIPKRFR